jgi:hypothetical protein
MAKEKKTAKQLEDMIRPVLAPFDIGSFGVHPTRDVSWHVIVVGYGTEATGDAHAAAENAARPLREQYDLVIE